MPWLPDGFEPPQRVDLPTGHHLRPIRADDVDIDYPAVMGSRERLWGIYGALWGWPPATMTYEQVGGGRPPRGAAGAALDDFVPGWLARTWGFRSVHIVR
jgi:hypothetical protein